MSLTDAEIGNRVTYHPPTDEARDRHGELRRYIEELMSVVAKIVPEGREQSLCITKIEEAMFWGNAGIARTLSRAGEGRQAS